MGISSDREFLGGRAQTARAPVSRAAQAARLSQAPAAAGRDDRVADRRLCRRQPRLRDQVVLLDSTPVECGRSLETARRSELADACGYGYCRSPLALVLGHAPAPALRARRHPRAAILAPADQKEREVALRLLPLALRGGEASICDKGYAGPEFAARVAERFGAVVLRPAAPTSPTTACICRASANAIESVFWTLKDRLGLERHRARTLAGLRARIAAKLLALAAGIWLNHRLGRPTRAFAELAV